MAPLRAKWGWIVALGIVYLVAGVVALGSVVAATFATVMIVGIMMIVSGVAEVINAFQVRTWGSFILWLLLGLLYIVSGFLAWDNPLLTAALLTLILGVSLVASGVMRIILAFGMRSDSSWVWVAMSGVVTAIVGLIILAHWPVNSIFLLGVFLGVDLVVAGVSWIGIGLSLRRAARA